MSDYTDAVLAKYPDAPAAVRKALAAALAAAEKAQQAQPGSTPVGVSDLKPTGAKASESAGADVMTFAESRPDVMLAKAAGDIALAEGVDFGTGMDLALQRDPSLALRYKGDDEARRRSSAVKVEPPRGMRLCETRADVELAERGKARAEADGITFSAAVDLVLAENPKLKSRYHDRAMGESALEELAYRVETICSANGGRVSQEAAVDAALSEDPALRESVLAYFEPNPYKSTD